MQPVTEAERLLLVQSGIEVDFGCEILNFDLTVDSTFGEGGDLSGDLRGGSITWNGDAKIHRTARLAVSTEWPWGSRLVKPYITVTDGTLTSSWPVGVFMVVTPEKPVGEDPVTYSVQAFDRIYLLDRKIADDYTVTSGTTYYDALVQVFTDAGLTGFSIDGDAVGYTVPTTKTWPLVARSTDPDTTASPVSWLRVINDLLLAINFRGVWADENGVFRCQRYLEPAVRAPEFTFDADDPRVSIVGEDRTVVQDFYKSPNRWVFLRTNGGTGVVGDGIYEVDGTDAELDARGGLDWPEVFEYEAASQAVLEDLGDRRVASDRRVTTTNKVTTGPFPVAGHWDVFTYRDAAAGGTSKVIATDWEFDLSGGDVSWTWERVS